MESQNKAIKAHLEKGYTINAIQALEMFGCFILAARIKDLKDDGMIKNDANKEGKHCFYWGN